MARDFGFEPTNKGDYYFISYNSEDADRVSQICMAMNNAGLSLWYDKGLHYGEKWEKEIADILSNCKACILFFSKGILNKEESYVKIEYDLAEHFKKNIYVVFLDRIDRDTIPNNMILWWIKICQHQTITVQDSIENYCNEIYKALNYSNNQIDNNQNTKTKPILKSDSSIKDNPNIFSNNFDKYTYIIYDIRDKNTLKKYINKIESNNISYRYLLNGEIEENLDAILYNIDNSYCVSYLLSNNSSFNISILKLLCYCNAVKKDVLIIPVDDNVNYPICFENKNLVWDCKEYKYTLDKAKEACLIISENNNKDNIQSYYLSNKKRERVENIFNLNCCLLVIDIIILILSFFSKVNVTLNEITTKINVIGNSWFIYIILIVIALICFVLYLLSIEKYSYYIKISRLKLTSLLYFISFVLIILFFIFNTKIINNTYEIYEKTKYTKVISGFFIGLTILKLINTLIILFQTNKKGAVKK